MISQIETGSRNPKYETVCRVASALGVFPASLMGWEETGRQTEEPIQEEGGEHMTFGERLKDARIAAGLTQQELGEACDLSTITIQQYETGKRTPNMFRLFILAKAVGTTAADLLGEEEKPIAEKSQLEVFRESAQELELGDQAALLASRTISRLRNLVAEMSDENCSVSSRIGALVGILEAIPGLMAMLE